MNLNKLRFSEFIKLSFIVAASLLYVDYFCKGITPRAIDWGLVLSGIVQYEHPSVMYSFLSRSPSIVFDITALLMSAGLNVEIISMVILAAPISINIYGVFLIINRLSEKEFFSLLIAILIVFSQVFFIWVDYPILFLSDHSGGVYSFSIVTLTIGLFLSKKFKILGFVLLFNFTIHPVVALLLIGIIFLWIIFNNLKNILNELMPGIFYGLILSGIYFLFKIYFFEIEYQAEFIYEDYLDWIKYWDTHRDQNYGNKGFLYIINQLIILLVLVSILKFKKFNNLKEDILFFIFIVLICLIIYLLKPLYPDFLRRFMVNRVAIIPQFVLMIYFIGIFLREGKYNFIRNILVFIFLIVFLASGFMINNHYAQLPDASYPKYTLKGMFLRLYLVTQPYIGGYRRGEIWKPVFDVNFDKDDISDVKKIYGNGLMVTTASINREALIGQRLPLILDSGGYDFVSYYPAYATEVKRIITDIYGLNYSGGEPGKQLDEATIEPIFRSRKASDWAFLSKKYGLRYVAVPVEWNLNLKLIFKNARYKLFVIE